MDRDTLEGDLDRVLAGLEPEPVGEWDWEPPLGSAMPISPAASVEPSEPEDAPDDAEDEDAGASWTPRTEGLPQSDAYLTILRQAFGHDAGEPLGLWFGATSGEVFGSTDAGATWSVAARDLAPVLSVRVA